MSDMAMLRHLSHCLGSGSGNFRFADTQELRSAAFMSCTAGHRPRHGIRP